MILSPKLYFFLSFFFSAKKGSNNNLKTVPENLVLDVKNIKFQYT